MKPPLHCGKPARGYARTYGNKKRPHSIEFGFTCSVCGQARIPTGQPTTTNTAADDLIRQEGIRFDESLRTV